MKVGDEVTWGKRTRNHQNRYKPMRYTTGVIIGERMNKNLGKREFEIAIRWFSGNLPDNPKSTIWVLESAILYGKCSAKKHVSKIAPMTLLRRRLKAEQAKVAEESAALIWKLNRALNDLKRAA